MIRSHSLPEIQSKSKSAQPKDNSQPTDKPFNKVSSVFRRRHRVKIFTPNAANTSVNPASTSVKLSSKKFALLLMAMKSALFCAGTQININCNIYVLLIIPYMVMSYLRMCRIWWPNRCHLPHRQVLHLIWTLLVGRELLLLCDGG